MMAPQRYPGLTPRYQQVAELLARELSYAEIAYELGLAHSTVKQYAKLAAARIPNPHRLTPRDLLKLYILAA